MKKNNMACLIIFLIFSFFAFNPEWSWAVVDLSIDLQTKDQKVPKTEKQKFKDGELLVRFKNGVTKEKAKQVHSKIGSEIIRSYSMPADLYYVKVKKNTPLDEIIDAYAKDPAVLYVEPNFIYTIQTVPNDPSFGSLWGLNNTGQTGGDVDTDINAPEVWNITTGSPDTIIAVIDTGVDYNHEDLAANIWTNPGEIPDNGIDDDGNGYIDDVHGINAITGSGNPMDDHNHGTHVSGTIAAIGNNSIGVAGVNWNAKIIGCKFLSSNGNGSSSDAIECLQYLYDLKTRSSNPVNIIASNNSWGGGGFSQAFLDSIDAHRTAGILFIAAAGNDETDNDTRVRYPSGYYMPNVISVAATNNTDILAWFTNYGRHTVHVAAPGDGILSTTLNNTYSTFSGTSMATPHVTGLVGLLKSQGPSRDWKALKNLVLSGGQDISALLTGATISGKRIRAYDVNGVGSLSCTNRVLNKRLRPVENTMDIIMGNSINLSVQHVNCAVPNGEVTVTVSDGTQLELLDNGQGFDQEAGDGIYSAVWTPQAFGEHTVTFPGNDIVTVNVVRLDKNYHSAVQTACNYRNTFFFNGWLLGDDGTATIRSRFPIHFGEYAKGFSDIIISKNGTLSFTHQNTASLNSTLPTTALQTLVAPFWDGLEASVVYWDTIGSSPNRELVIEWRDIHDGWCEGAASFQVVFFENSSDILFNYEYIKYSWSCDDGRSATVGVQVDSTLAQQFSYNTASLKDSFSLLWKVDLPPVADAGPDQFARSGALVTLNGTGSNDVNGPIAGISWTQTAGTPVILTGADTTTPSCTAPNVSGTLTFQLTVTDDTGQTATDTVNIIVNVPPVADAGPEQTVLSRVRVYLDGTGSRDPDGSIAGYAWTRIAGPYAYIYNANTAHPYFTAPDTSGTITFQLIATDNSGEAASDTVNVSVLVPPVAKAGPDQTVLPNAAVTLDGTGSYDPDGTITSYAWTQTAGTTVTLTGADTSSPSFTAPLNAGKLTFQLTVIGSEGVSKSDTVDVIVFGQPLANAGPDQLVQPGAVVTLDGAESYDPDGTISGYAWEQISGAPVSITGSNTAKPVFTAPGSSGTLFFQLTVTDNSGFTSADAVNIIVNALPTADAGPDQSIISGATVTLNGTGSYDPDGSISSYSWAQTAGGSVTLTGANTASPTFTAPKTGGTRTFRLTVTDNIGQTASDTVNVLVLVPPTASAGLDQTVRSGQTVILTGTASKDSDGTIESYAWTQTAGTAVAITGADTATPRFTAPGTQGTLTFQLTVTDNSGLTSSDIVVISVNIQYNPAIETGFGYRAITGTKLTQYYYDVATITAPFPVYFANAPSGYTTLNISKHGHISFTNKEAAPSNYELPTGFQTMVAPFWDALDLNFHGGIYWGVIGTAPNRELVIEWHDVGGANSAGSITFQVVFLENSSDILFNYADVLFGNNSYYDSGGSATVGVQVSSTIAQQYSYKTQSLRNNLALLWKITDSPTADAGPDQTVVSGTTGTLNGAGSSDLNGSIVSYAWTQLSGTTVALANADQATPSFAAPSTAGTLTFRLIVTDNSGKASADTVNVLVRVPPLADAGTDQFVLPGANATLNGAGSSDPDGTVVSYTWEQVAGAQVVLVGPETATPVFSAPNMQDTLTFRLTVTDNTGLTSADTVNIIIDIPPVADAGPDQTVTTGTAAALTGSGHDPDGTVVSYTWVQTAGIVVTLANAATATPSFTAPNVSGTLTFQLTVKDNLGATGTDSVNVLVNKPPVANAGPDQTVTANTQATLNGAGSTDPDGTITSYAWAQTAGTTVTLTGADTAQPGFTTPNVTETLTFKLTVTDNMGATTSDTVSIFVNRPPVANAGPDQPVTVNTVAALDGAGSSDPDGTITSYAWTQTGGAGVSLTGANTATPGFTAPNASGVLSFQLTVTDNQGATSSDTVNVTVNLPPAANAGPDQLVKIRSAVALNGSASSDSDGTITRYAWVQIYGTPVPLTGANTAAPGFTAPDTEGKLTFSLTVTDNNGANASDQVTITATKSGR